MVKNKSELSSSIVNVLMEQEYITETSEHHINQVKEIIRKELEDYIIIDGFVLS